MKRVLSVFFFLSFSFCSFSQEFDQEPSSNGLMYSQKTINQLHEIVDSLNLKFKVCELEKTYLAKAQAIGHYFKMTSGDMKAAKADLENDISYQDFQKKYSNAEIKEDQLIVKFIFDYYDGDRVVEFQSFPENNSVRIHDNPEIYEKEMKGETVFRYSEPGEWSQEKLYGFFFSNGFESQSLPEKYARMVQYSDCMIDTSEQIYFENAERGYINLRPDLDELSGKEKKELLKKFRNTKVVGSCSQDDSPRVHARNIAILSAETVNWEIFLRAHLDIMNDRFERVSDGSYAWGGRKTYIRELEELEINVVDLLLGISFRVENPSENHYYGSIQRVGRALAESKNLPAIETEMAETIGDDSLDDFNRILTFYLYRTCVDNFSEEKRKDGEIRLKKAAEKLPRYLFESLVLKNNLRT